MQVLVTEQCIVCRKSVASEMIVMPRSARLDLLLVYRIFAPHGIRCCSSYLINDTRLRLNQYIDREGRSLISASLSSEDVQDLLNSLVSSFNELRSSPRLDFDDTSVSSEDYETWTGWTKSQFDSIFQEVSGFLRSSENRTSRNAMAIFWIKVKTNLSFRQIGSLFNMGDDSEMSRLRTSHTFDSVRELLVKHFVSKWLGIGHLKVEDTKAHNTSYSKVG